MKMREKELGVAEFYTQFPYPFSETGSSIFVSNAVGILATLNIETKILAAGDICVLDFGCGTGQRILSTARALPSIRFVAIDISEASIKLARAQALAWGISNVEFIACACEAFEWRSKFDVVLSTGVLHHIPDPLSALANIGRLVKNDGLILQWVYHAYGEHDRLLDRDRLLLLASQTAEDFQGKMDLMRELGLSISPKRYGPSFGESTEIENGSALSRDADAYLNPNVVAYTFDSMANLVRNAEFDWISYEHVCFDHRDFLISLESSHQNRPSVLKVPKILKGVRAQEAFWRLSPINQLRVLELSAKPTGFTFACGRSPAITRLSNRTRSTLRMLQETTRGSE